MRSSLCVLFLVSIAACQPDAPIGPHAATHFELADTAHVSLAALHGPNAPQTGGPHPVTDAFRESVIDASTMLVRVNDTSDDWTDMDTPLRTYLADAHPDPTVQAWREISIASSFLPGHLVNRDELTPEKQKAIAFYATLLIENRQLGGDKVANALDRLDGFWPDAKLAEARQLVDEATLHTARASRP